MKRVIKSTYLFYALVLTALIAIGYFREYIFVSINYQLYRIYYKVTSEYPLADQLGFLNDFSYKQLVGVKWFLTFIFTLIYFFITLATLYKLFGKTKPVTKITVWLHVLLVVIAACCYSYDLLFSNTQYKGYEMSRIFMGLLQSPFVLMILIPTFKLSVKLSVKLSDKSPE